MGPQAVGPRQCGLHHPDITQTGSHRPSSSTALPFPITLRTPCVTVLLALATAVAREFADDCSAAKASPAPRARPASDTLLPSSGGCFGGVVSAIPLFGQDRTSVIRGLSALFVAGIPRPHT